MRRGSRREFLFLVLVSLLAVIPVWVSKYPPMADLPQHAAQVELFRNLQQHSPFAYLYRMNWFTPYLFGYLLIYVLLPLCNVLTACKIVISIALVAMPISTALVIRENAGDTRWAYLTIPGLYGFAYAWGLVNYVVAAPLGMLMLWSAMRHSRRQSVVTYLGLAALTVLLFFCHALVCAYFMALAGIVILLEVPGWAAKIVRIAPMLVVIPVGALWAQRQLAAPTLQHRETFWDLGWFHSTDFYYSMHPGWGRLAGFMPRILGHDPRVATDLLGLLIFTIPLITGARPIRRLSLWIPFLTSILILFLAPNNLFGATFVFMRFAIFALPFFVVGFGAPIKPSRTRIANILTGVVVLASLLWTVADTRAFNRQAQPFDLLLAHMEPEQRALGMIFERESGTSITPLYLHFAQWYSALKEGSVDPGFAAFFPEPVAYRPGLSPRATVESFEWNPAQFRWKVYHGGDYRYFVVRAETDIAPRFFAEAPCPVQLRFHEGPWWLYERSENCVSAK